MSDATVSPPPVSPPPVSPPPAGAVRRTRRQRRPTGAPPPLPRRIITVTTTAWLLLVVVTVGGGFLAAEDTPWRRAGDQLSTWLLRIPAAVRTPWLTHLAEGINVAVLDWHPVIGIAVVLATMAFRRWRQLAVLLFSLFFLEIAGNWIYDGLSRPRPYGVRIIGSWDGYSAPATVVAALTFFGMGAVYCLAVPGRPRSYAKAAVAAVVAAFCLSRLYLAVDHPDDLLFGLGLGVPIPVTAFRFFTPNEVFPVVYRRGRDRARRGDWPPRSGDPGGDPRPAGAHRAGDQAGRPGLLRWVDAVAPDRGGGPGSVPVRQALHAGSRARRPVVQAVAHDLLRRPGRRAPVLLGETADPVRGLRAAPAPGRGHPRFMLVRMYTVAGGCITYQFSFAAGAAPSLAIFVEEAIAFEPRSVLVDYIRHSEGLALCGRGAACPG